MRNNPRFVSSCCKSNYIKIGEDILTFYICGKCDGACQLYYKPTKKASKEDLEKSVEFNQSLTYPEK